MPLIRLRNHSATTCRCSPSQVQKLQEPMLSAIRMLTMTHRSICLPDFPAVSHR